jgi:fructokinase
MAALFAGIEAGGTKFVCALGSGPEDLRAQVAFPTTTPKETLGRVAEFIEQGTAQYGPVAAIGVAAFGPLDPNPTSETYGYITSTPKPGWANCNIVGALKEKFGLPVGFDTDVNGAALGEWRWGAAQGLEAFIYLTIGTGIGGGGYA